MTEPIIPEPLNFDADYPPGHYTPGRWDYPKRCADIDLAMEVTRERVEEWDMDADLDGWWHQRTMLIALHNEVVTLRRAVGQMESIIDDEWGVLSDDDHFPLPDETWETVKRVRATEKP